MSRAYLLLILAALLMVTGAVGYRQGHQAATTQARADLATHLSRAIAQADEQARQDREVLIASEARRERLRTVFQTLETEVIRYATLHVSDGACLSPDGLRLWTHANAGTDPGASAAPVEPYAGGAAGTGLGQGAGPARQSRDFGSAIPLVPGESPEPRRLGGERPPYWGWR